MRKMLLIGAVMLMAVAASAQAAVVVVPARPVVMARPATVTPVRPATPPSTSRPAASRSTKGTLEEVRQAGSAVMTPPYIFHSNSCSEERRKRKECS